MSSKISAVTPVDSTSDGDGPRKQSPFGSGLVGSFGASAALPPSKSEHFSNLFWKHKHATATYCFVFWSFGMCVAFLGPTLLDLGCKTSSVFATMSWVFFAQTLFILIGSASGGFMVAKFTANPVLFVSIIMLAITMAMIPLCDAVVLLALVLAVMGFFMGTIDTVANVSMIALYGKDVSPFLQALHFFYGLGAFLSPMIVEPFLLNEDCSKFIDNSSVPVSDLMGNETEPAETLVEAQHMTKINYAFWIMSMLQIPVVILVFSLLARQLYHDVSGETESPARQREEYEVMDKGLKLETADTLDRKAHEEGHSLASPQQAIILTVLTALLLFLYDGLQAAYGGYVYSYAVKSIANLNKTEAAYLNACFWGTFAFGRLVSIAIATKLSPGFMLLCNISGCLFSMILMLCLHHDHVTLYVGTCMFGVFLSSIYPTAISLAEQYINVTSNLASCIIVGAATGEMMLPVIVGHEFDRVGPLSLLVTGVVITILSIFVYAAIWVTGNAILRVRAGNMPNHFPRDVTPGVYLLEMNSNCGNEELIAAIE